MKRKLFFTKCVLTAILLIMYIPTLLAQMPGDPGGDPDEIPIDGGIGLLIAAGVAYGAKKAYDKRKKDPGAKDGLKKVE